MKLIFSLIQSDVQAHQGVTVGEFCTSVLVCEMYKGPVILILF
jgi:hypothetical protein